MIEVKVPSLGVALANVKLGSLLKQIGDPVKEGEAIAEAESDKVNFQIYSPGEGLLLKYFANSGDFVDVGSVLAVVGNKEEMQDAQGMEAGGAAEVKAEEKPAEAKAVEEKAPATRARIYPAARKLLAEYGLDASEVVGTGPGGAITKEDVLKAAEQAKGKAAEPAAAPVAEAQEEEIIPFTGIRKTIADNMRRSLDTLAHVTNITEVDMTAVADLRKKMRAELGDEIKTSLSLVSFVAKAVQMAIEEFPMVNCTIDGDKIIVKKYVHMGIAVGLEKGLVVPVIRNIEKKNLLEVDAELSAKIDAANEGKLLPEDMRGGTISISNAGTNGSIIATPIINYPQSVLVWLGQITKRPVVVNDEIVVRRMMYLCLAYDHRAVDGATIAKFGQKIKYYLEKPLNIVAR